MISAPVQFPHPAPSPAEAPCGPRTHQELPHVAVSALRHKKSPVAGDSRLPTETPNAADRQTHLRVLGTAPALLFWRPSWQAAERSAQRPSHHQGASALTAPHRSAHLPPRPCHFCRTPAPPNASSAHAFCTSVCRFPVIQDALPPVKLLASTALAWGSPTVMRRLMPSPVLACGRPFSSATWCNAARWRAVSVDGKSSCMTHCRLNAVPLLYEPLG